MKSTLLSSVCLLALCGELLASPHHAGDTIPDTTLRDESGNELKLRDLVQEKTAVLIFYRGGWCPYCTRHLSALVEIEKEIFAARHQILAISPDQPTKLAETPDREKLNYCLLSDSGMETAKGFGIAFEVDAVTREKYKQYGIDLEAASGQTHYLMPHPAIFIVDTKGVIRFA